MNSNNKNIMHILTNAADGGLERIVFEIISTLKLEFNHHVVLLTNNNNGLIYNKLIDFNINVHVFDFDNRYRSIRSILKNFKQLIKLSKLIKDFKIEIIHTHDFFPALISRISYIISRILLFHKIKYVYVVYNSEYIWLSSFHHKINKILSNLTTNIICVSKSAKEYSIKHDRIKSDKYLIIYNGIDTEKFKNDDKLKIQQKILYQLDNKIVIGNVGVLSKVKDQITLIKAFDSLINEFDNIHLVLVGSGRSNELNVEKEIYNYIEERNLSDKITFLPTTDNVNLYYNIFDIFVMPSIAEGFGLCAIEAMSSENITLLSDINIFKEFINDGQNGYLFKKRDKYDLKEKLLQVIKNIDKLDYIKTNARKTSLLFNKTIMINKYRDLYNKS